MASRSRILLVDDDRELVHGLALRLRAAGYEVTAASDGEEGLRLAERIRPDVVVLDVRMPQGDGLTALTQLRYRRATRTTPVIVLSACAAERRRVLDLGARFFFEKPYDSKSLLSAIARSIAGNGDTANENAPSGNRRR